MCIHRCYGRRPYPVAPYFTLSATVCIAAGYLDFICSRQATSALRRRRSLPCTWRRSRQHLHGPSQPFDRGSDRLTCVATEAKHKCGSRSRCKIKTAHRSDDDAVLASGALDGHIREASPREGHEMHPWSGALTVRSAPSWRLRAATSSSRCSLYSRRMRRICAAKWPSSMKAATTAWLNVDGCRSIK